MKNITENDTETANNLNVWKLIFLVNLDYTMFLS